MSKNSSLKYTFGIVAITLAVLTFFLHGSALKAGWRVDDPWILLYITEHPDILGYFFSPSQWQSLGVPFFTPWLALDFRLDAALFGINPQAFYLHHLIIIWLVALLTFILLRRVTGLFWSSAAAALFLTGAPVAIIGQQLMSRHYATGLLFVLITLFCWLKNREQRGWLLPLLAATCYLASMLNKEIFAPLPLVLFFWGKNDLKRRFMDLLPFAFAAILFVIWRAVMLGAVVGGYTGRINIPGDWLYSVTALPHIFMGPESFISFIGLLLLLMGWYLNRISFWFVFASFISVSLPFLAIRASTNVQDLRFAFLPWWTVCVFIAVACSRLTSSEQNERFSRLKFLYMPLVIIFSVLAFKNGRAMLKKYTDIAVVYDVQGRFLWTNGDEVAYIPAGEVASALQFQYALSSLKKLILKKQAPQAVPTLESASWFAMGLPLYIYDVAGHFMTKVLPDSGESGSNPALSLDIKLDRRQGGFEWFIYEPGEVSCFLLFPRLNASFLIPCKGKIHFTPPPFIQGDVYAFVSNPKKQWSVSSLLQFPEKGAVVTWKARQDE